MLSGLWNLAQGSLDALPGLSLSTLEFICIFPAWPMGVYGFCLSWSCLLGTQVFSLSLMVFDGWIGDLYKICFVGGDFDFLGGVVHVWVVDSMCAFAWRFLFIYKLMSLCLLKFSQEYFFQVLLKLWPIIQFQLDQFLYQSSIFFSVDWLYLPSMQQRHLLFSLHPERTHSFTSSISFSFL